jgi:hypothetical protein
MYTSSKEDSGLLNVKKNVEDKITGLEVNQKDYRLF